MKCPYCGKPAHADKGFCSRCLKHGFDGVYEVTGKSNGWDAPARRPGKWRTTKFSEWTARGYGLTDPNAIPSPLR